MLFHRNFFKSHSFSAWISVTVALLVLCVCIVHYFCSDIVTKNGNNLPFFISTFFVFAFEMCSVLIYHRCFGEFGIGVAFYEAPLFCDSFETLIIGSFVLFSSYF